MNPRLAAMLLLLLLVTALAGGIASCTSPSLTPGAPDPAGNPSGGGFVPNPTADTGGNSGGNGNGGNGNNGGGNIAPNPSGGIPAGAPRIAPPPNTYQGCPATGDGGDPGLNAHKNRTDSAPWYPVQIADLLALPWPKAIERRRRDSWTAGDAAAIARYEGIPVQVEGYLAGAKQEGPESCNCHAADDVDNHLWIVDGPAKDRAQAVVVEITPRVRAQHPGWAFARVNPLVDGRTRVRISGWLMMDQEHPDQIGNTRGTIWEIHPIIAFDVQRGNEWIALDTGRAATTTTAPGNAEAAPTEDPHLPPALVETPEPNTPPTRTPRPAQGSGGGHTTGAGPLEIADIFYDGANNPSESDEYVELHNLTNSPVNLDGWVLRDVYGGQEFTWHGVTLQPGKRIRVYTNEHHAESGGFSFGSGSAIWNNKGDAAELQDANGNVVATFAYGDKR
ncbi:MAG: lamin tail domain-containing protein [Chloroflexota bacterium]|nr:lamin tail domain-containing protein [Chloroflexota bacterium]